MVSEIQPAHPGELVAAYMTGLGPVDEYGRVDAGFRCTLEDAPVDARYAGNRSYPGFYQINLVIPDVRRLQLVLWCGWDDDRRSAPADLWVAR